MIRTGTFQNQYSGDIHFVNVDGYLGSGSVLIRTGSSTSGYEGHINITGGYSFVGGSVIAIQSGKSKKEGQTFMYLEVNQNFLKVTLCQLFFEPLIQREEDLEALFSGLVFRRVNQGEESF